MNFADTFALGVAGSNANAQAVRAK